MKEGLLLGGVSQLFTRFLFVIKGQMTVCYSVLWFILNISISSVLTYLWNTNIYYTYIIIVAKIKISELYVKMLKKVTMVY